MSYDINILVHGSRCKQYHHNGRTFIEAKDGSEYTIEIRNNTWRRILACISVDGLNILNGQTATENGPGYVINGYSSDRYDGFRISDTQVAKFIFGRKENSYAASKEDGSERNVGVIGVRLFEELIDFSRPCYKSSNYSHILREPVPTYGSTTGDPMPPQPNIWCDTSTSSTTDYGIPTKGLPPGVVKRSLCADGGQSAIYSGEVALQGFDMGTSWGGAKESRVVEVKFQKGLLALTFDVYYASRQSLIEMGVPLGNEKQVNFPVSFADSKYAKPPKNWKG